MFLLLLLSIHLLAPEDDNLPKALAQYCFLVFRRIGEYIFLDLFCFVNLTSTCSLIPQTNLVFICAGESGNVVKVIKETSDII